MNSKHMMTMACAVALCGSVQAETNEQVKVRGEGEQSINRLIEYSNNRMQDSSVQPSIVNQQPTTNNQQPSSSWNWAMGEGITYNETPIVSAEVSLAFDSKFLSYGLVDNNDPILTPAASLTLFDWVTVGVEAIFDISHYGEAAGYGDRAWRYQELDPRVAIGHTFGPDDAAWLPTSIKFEAGYSYESHPPSICDDTQFFAFAIGLPDLWIEPAFSYELDLERDHGTYLNIELGHTFTLIGPREEDGDDILDFRLSAAQGWGDRKRVCAYLPDIHAWEREEPSGLDHAGLMDTCFKGEFTWNIVDGVTLGAYVAYSDYLFDPSTREAARYYEATGAWDKTWNFVTGVSLAVAF